MCYRCAMGLTVLTVGLSGACVQAQDTMDPDRDIVVENVERLLQENFEQYTPEYMGGCPQELLPIPTWKWYWTRKAYLDPALPCFGGDDAVSRAFALVAEKAVIPLWNAVMEADVVRAALLVVCVGMLLGVGAKLVKAA
ncbi:MAG TPA: hypothetical protein VI542_04710 [Candidatus Tectomicrobia bacterium]